jgi:hypothetical protein
MKRRKCMSRYMFFVAQLLVVASMLFGPAAFVIAADKDEDMAVALVEYMVAAGL